MEKNNKIAIVLFNKFKDIQDKIQWGDEKIIAEAEKNYKKEYEEYFDKLAKESALLCIEELIENCVYFDKNDYNMFNEIKNEIQKL